MATLLTAGSVTLRSRGPRPASLDTTPEEGTGKQMLQWQEAQVLGELLAMSIELNQQIREGFLEEVVLPWS